MDLYFRYLATGFAYHQLPYLKSLSSFVSTISLKSDVGNRWRNLVASHWILGNYLCGVLIVPRWYIFDPWYIEWSNSKASPSNRFSGPLYFIITGGYSTVTLNSMGLTCSSPIKVQIYLNELNLCILTSLTHFCSSHKAFPLRWNDDCHWSKEQRGSQDRRGGGKSSRSDWTTNTRKSLFPGISPGIRLQNLLLFPEPWHCQKNLEIASCRFHGRVCRTTWPRWFCVRQPSCYSLQFFGRPT